MVVTIGWTTPILLLLQIRVGHLYYHVPKKTSAMVHMLMITNDNVPKANNMGQNKPTMMVVLAYDMDIDEIIYIMI